MHCNPWRNTNCFGLQRDLNLPILPETFFRRVPAVINVRFAKLPRIYIFGFAVFGMIMTIPGQTAGVSAFIDYLIKAMSLNRVQVSIAYLIGTITSAFLLTPAGKLYDRLGSRVVGTAAIAGLGMSLFALTRAPLIAGALGQSGLGALQASMIVMTIGFFMIRFCGQGVLELVSRSMMLKWYDDRRGLANAVFSGVMPVAFSLAPLLFNQLINSYGWQGAWRFLGLLLMPFAALIALFTFSDPDKTSRESGQAGKARALVRTQIPAILSPLIAPARRLGLRRTSEPMSPPRDRSLAEAMHHLSFWVFLAAIATSSALSTGLTFHVVGVFAGAGIGRAAALAVFFPVSIVSVVVLTGSSVISDFIRLKYFVVLHGTVMALTLLSIPLLPLGPWAYGLLVFFWGISTAMSGVSQSVVWPRFFGLSHLGEISGFSAAWMVAGSAFGPYAFSLAHSVTGSFHHVAWLAAPLCATIAILGFFANNPNRKDAVRRG